MVEFPLRNNIFEIAEKAVPGAKGSNEAWFAEDVEIKTSNDFKGGIIVVDFSLDVSAIVEYTLGGQASGPWVALNNGVAVAGGQSRYIRVENGDLVNFRAVLAGTLNRAIIGQV